MKVKELNTIKARKSHINDCLDEINQERKIMMLYSSESEFDVKMIEKSKEFCILKKQQIDKQKKDIDDIICILDSLSSEYKELLGMYYLKGIKSKVCAEILGISLNTFATRKKEAIKMFESR